MRNAKQKNTKIYIFIGVEAKEYTLFWIGTTQWYLEF